MAFKSFSLCAGAVRAGLWPFVRRGEGMERLPKGPCIVVCNHSTFLDGPIMAEQFAWAQYRPLHMVAYDLPFAHPIMGYVLRSGRNIPLGRGRSGAARAMMARALAHLARGDAVGMFPEAHLNRSGRLGRARPGTALLALESGAPVVVTALTGGTEVWPEGRILPKVGRGLCWRIGEVLGFEEEANLYKKGGLDKRKKLVTGVMDRMMAVMGALLDKYGHR